MAQSACYRPYSAANRKLYQAFARFFRSPARRVIHHSSLQAFGFDFFAPDAQACSRRMGEGEGEEWEEGINQVINIIAPRAELYEELRAARAPAAAAAAAFRVLLLDRLPLCTS